MPREADGFEPFAQRSMELGMLVREKLEDAKKILILCVVKQQATSDLPGPRDAKKQWPDLRCP